MSIASLVKPCYSVGRYSMRRTIFVMALTCVLPLSACSTHSKQFLQTYVQHLRTARADDPRLSMFLAEQAAYLSDRGDMSEQEKREHLKQAAINYAISLGFDATTSLLTAAVDHAIARAGEQPTEAQ